MQKKTLLMFLVASTVLLILVAPASAAITANVHVQDATSGQPIQSAYVSLGYQTPYSGIHAEEGYTDASGNVNLAVTYSGAYWANWLVQAPGYVDASGSGAPATVVLSRIATNPTPTPTAQPTPTPTATMPGILPTPTPAPTQPAVTPTPTSQPKTSSSELWIAAAIIVVAIAAVLGLKIFKKP